MEDKNLIFSAEDLVEKSPYKPQTLTTFLITLMLKY
jgi:hypothetical protein